MPKINYRFDIAAMLLASVLTVIGISAAEAGRKGGSNAGEFRNGSTTNAAGARHDAPGSQGGAQTNGGARGGIVE